MNGQRVSGGGDGQREKEGEGGRGGKIERKGVVRLKRFKEGQRKLSEC